MLKCIDRIQLDNPIYDTINSFTPLFNDNPVKDLYKVNLLLINDWLYNTDVILNRTLKYLLTKLIITKDDCNIIPDIIKSKWDEIEKNLLIILKLFTDNYLYEYFLKYHTDNKVLYSCTLYSSKEVIDKEGNSSFGDCYNYVKAKTVNDQHSEPYTQARIELAFRKHPVFKNYDIINYKSEPCGENKCPDHGWDILDPNGEDYGKLYIETKTSKTDRLKNGNLRTPSYSSCGRTNKTIEECFLPITKIKTTNEWKINPCFFTIIVFIDYVELSYVHDNVEYKMLQYYISIPNMLQLSIEYNKNNSNQISILSKNSTQNTNTMLRPNPQIWLVDEFNDMYSFMKWYLVWYPG